MWNAKEIQEQYKKLDDWKIIELANNAKTLRKDIIPILNQEITTRNLGIELLNWVKNEAHSFEGLERKTLIEKIKRSTCTSCTGNSELDGYVFITVVSWILGSSRTVSRVIICRDCAKKQRIKSLTQTLLLGWWSKSGIFMTPFEVVSGIFRTIRRESESAEVIDEFINNNTGRIRKQLEKGGNLQNLLRLFNKPETINE